MSGPRAMIAVSPTFSRSRAPSMGANSKGIDLLPLLIQWVAYWSKCDAARLSSDGRPRTLKEIYPVTVHV